MLETLADEYLEAAPHVQQAVDEHGEEWVLEQYYEQLYPLRRLVEMPEKGELPVYDAGEHDTMREEERVEMYEEWAEYRETLWTETRRMAVALHFSQRYPLNAV